MHSVLWTFMKSQIFHFRHSIIRTNHNTPMPIPTLNPYIDVTQYTLLRTAITFRLTIFPTFISLILIYTCHKMNSEHFHFRCILLYMYVHCTESKEHSMHDGMLFCFFPLTLFRFTFLISNIIKLFK